MNNYEKIAELLFPNITKTPEYYEKMYPARKLNETQKVTRFAPSPTGYVHMGSLLTCFYDYIIAKQSKGVFYLRIEDTDLERTVEHGVEGIVEDLAAFDIHADEGVDEQLQSYGNYGPYIQTSRQEIYLTYAKDLVRRGLAYPCFCTKEELGAIRQKQEENKETQIGYYGHYAKCRDLSYEQVEDLVKAGRPFVIRFKATGKIGDRARFYDVLRGEQEMADNVNDPVIIKSKTFLPPYNFAHAIDDHLMGTTTVIRSNEWLNSTPEHIQLFHALGFKEPEYCHVAFVQKFDDETGQKRKISKRKDPETAVSYMVKAGYPTDSVMEYLYTIANTNFEEWRIANPDKDREEFMITLDKMSLSGALFDLVKFNDVSKNVISRMTAEKVYDLTCAWAKQYDKEWAEVLSSNKDYAVKMFSIDRYTQKPRKDIVKWEDTKGLYSYFFDSLFDGQYEEEEGMDKEILRTIFDRYLDRFDENVDNTAWFEMVKSIGEDLGYCPQVKEYKKNPEAYRGHCGTVCTYIRIALTGRKNTPDLFSICKLFGVEKMRERMNAFLATL